MILEVTRGHIKLMLDKRTITVPGEMFFPSNNKMGFALAMSDKLCWDAPHQHQLLTNAESLAIIHDIQMEFDRGGHTLEVNWLSA